MSHLHNNDRVRIRLSIGDGLRFGIGFVIAPLLVWSVLVLAGLFGKDAISWLLRTSTPVHEAPSRGPR